jgi:hypothetical protein
VKRLEVKIPPGVKNGSRVRIAGRGQTGYGGVSGDLYLVVSVKPHPQLERKGDNLHVAVTVPLTVAVLGGEVKVPTLKGELELRIPPETQNGRVNSDDTEPRYVISVAARMLSVRTHTLRYYERIGIIEPSRSRGNIRLYSERDVAWLRRAKTLIDDLGVNLAGVEVILHMAQQMTELQSKLAELEAS